MNDDKSLSVTVKSTFYQGEKNADSITFLIPSSYHIDFTACDVSMRCIMPNGAGRAVPLTLLEERHKDYYQYRLAVTEDITVQAGGVDVWMVAKDRAGKVVLRTGAVSFDIKPNPAYLPQAGESGGGGGSADDVIYF